MFNHGKPESTVQQDTARLVKIHKAIGPDTALEGMTNTDLIRDLWFTSPLLKHHKPKSKHCAIDSLVRFHKFFRKQQPQVKGLVSREEFSERIDTLYAWKKSLRTEISVAEVDKFVDNLDKLITVEDLRKAKMSLQDIERRIDEIESK